MIVCDCKDDHVTAALFMSELSSIMSLLISDTQIKAKILPGDHAFSFCVPKLRNDSLEHIQCKMGLNIRSSKNNLKALKTSKRYFYFVVLFNNFSIL